MDRYKIGSGTLSLIMERYHAGGIPIEELQMMPPKEEKLLFYPQKNIKKIMPMVTPKFTPICSNHIKSSVDLCGYYTKSL